MDLKDFIVKQSDIEEVVEEDTKPKFNIFSILEAITYTKEDLDFNDDLVKKTYDQYMINRWLSMARTSPKSNTFIYLDIIELVNTMGNLTDYQHYDLLRSVIPKHKLSWYKMYLSKEKDLSVKEKRYIAHYYQIGLKEAEDYIKQMEQEEIDEVLKKYKYGKNELIKI